MAKTDKEPNPSDPPALISTQEAATLTGYSVVRIHDLISKGRMVGARRIGKRKWGIPVPVTVVTSLGRRELLQRVEGHSMRACGRDCTDAQHNTCRCICGGKNHGSNTPKGKGLGATPPNKTTEQPSYTDN